MDDNPSLGAHKLNGLHLVNFVVVELNGPYLVNFVVVVVVVLCPFQNDCLCF